MKEREESLLCFIAGCHCRCSLSEEKAASVVLEFSLDVEEITTEENNNQQGALSGWRVEKDEVSVKYVTYKLQRMHIYDEKKKRENELVLYRDRLWRLLMGKEGSEGGGGANLEKDKEKWWENERRMFRGYADSFIARMHLVQGDRRFSRWK
ncbi:unnamed protein product [Lactuca saligna]|uniref:Uncharacterized protein n=1 Tax=Lactuca saligna TaxID=75948 RepID=A0AA35VH85_LACSI|nr:unnamed protein product [Lactuca saligna]